MKPGFGVQDSAATVAVQASRGEDIVSCRPRGGAILECPVKLSTTG